MQRHNRILAAAAVAACLAIGPLGPLHGVEPSRAAESGDLDPTFGTNGATEVDFGWGHANALAVQPDGRIVVAGEGDCSFGVARLTADGAVDSGFGAAGKATARFMANYCERAFAVAVQPDGRIVVAGAGGSLAHQMSSGFAVARFTVEGNLDPSFDGDGMVLSDFDNVASEQAFAVGIQTDGKVVVAGSAEGFLARGWAVVRYAANGSIDKSFGNDGMAEPPFGIDQYGVATALALQADGKIVVAGTSGDRFAVARYGDDGRLDTTFGTGGWVTTEFAGSSSWAKAIAIQGDGRIVVGGGATTDRQHLAIARYHGDGSADTSFGQDGRVTLQGFEYASDVEQLPDGRVVAAGWAYGTDSDSALASFDPDGRLDGRTVIDLGGSDSVYAMALQPDGKIVTAGAGRDTWAVARLSRITPIKELRPTPALVDFGNVFAGSSSGEVAIRVTNPSSRVAVAIDAVELGGGDPASFQLKSQGCAVGPLAPGGQCEITLAFAPRLAGVAGTELRIHGDADAGTLVVPLTGTAIDPISLSPTSVWFGSTYLGTHDDPEVVTFENVGVLPLAVSSVTIAGTNADDFAIVADTCTAGPIASSGACSLRVGFRPSGPGARAATLTISGPGPVGVRSVALSGDGVKSPSSVAWGTTYRAGPAYTWNAGNALARTVQSGTQRLHLAYATDRIGSAWAKDVGPYMGVYYVRSTSGTTWSTPKRLNPSTQHAERPGLAGAGSRVYATWVSQTKIARYSATAPRVLYVRVNTSHGASTSWKSPIRLTSTSGRVDYPTIAAYGYDVHVAWTDAVTGSIKVATSRDRGVTWKKASVGTTSLYDRSGRYGLPAVAVSGSTVAVAWLADRSGTVNARVSTNRGASWGPIATIGTQSWSRVSVAVRGSRVAVAWASAADLVVSLRVAGAWGEPVVAGSVTPTPDDPYLYAPSVVLQDPARIAVAWSEALDEGRERSNLRWAESADGGASWFATQTLATTSSSRRLNDDASVLWPAAGTRYVVWGGWTPYSTSYRLYLRKGTGAPVGPTSVAPAWVPAAEGPTTVPESGERVTPRVAPDGRRVEAPSTE